MKKFSRRRLFAMLAAAPVAAPAARATVAQLNRVFVANKDKFWDGIHALEGSGEIELGEYVPGSFTVPQNPFDDSKLRAALAEIRKQEEYMLKAEFRGHLFDRETGRWSFEKSPIAKQGGLGHVGPVNAGVEPPEIPHPDEIGVTVNLGRFEFPEPYPLKGEL